MSGTYSHRGPSRRSIRRNRRKTYRPTNTGRPVRTRNAGTR